MRERRRRRRPHPPMSMTREERRVVDTMSLWLTFDEAEVDSSVTDALLVEGDSDGSRAPRGKARRRPDQ